MFLVEEKAEGICTIKKRNGSYWVFINSFKY